MSLSADLIDRYTSEMRIDWHNAFVLSHPSAGAAYLIDHHTELEGLVDNFPQLFRPVPSQIVLPARDDGGTQELSVVWCGIEDEARTFLDAAIADGTQPIRVRYSVYIEGNAAPQIDPWIELTLTSIAVSRESVAAVATRADILNRRFPTEVYRVDRYPGLRRR